MSMEIEICCLNIINLFRYQRWNENITYKISNKKTKDLFLESVKTQNHFGSNIKV